MYAGGLKQVLYKEYIFWIQVKIYLSEDLQQCAVSRLIGCRTLDSLTDSLFRLFQTPHVLWHVSEVVEHLDALPFFFPPLSNSACATL